MSIKDLLQDLVNEKLTGYEVIRIITGMIDPDQAINIIALVNQITRFCIGDMDKEYFIEAYGLSLEAERG